MEIRLIGTAPLRQNCFFEAEREKGENILTFNERTWQERAKWDESGQMLIPRRSVKVMLYTTAKYRAEKIPGMGKATYTKHFKAGVDCTDFQVFDVDGAPITRKNVEKEIVYEVTCSGNRVVNFYPMVRNWTATGEIFIKDVIITEKVLLEHLKVAGEMVGLGSFRISTGGNYGTFNVE